MKKKEKNKNGVKDKNKRVDAAILIICAVILIISGIILTVNGAFKEKEYNVDYFSFKVKKYDKVDDNTFENKDKTCRIKVFSQPMTDININDFGQVQKINGNDWAYQKNEKGAIWIAYYKNILYNVSMEATGDKDCNEEFTNIKNTFSFLKNE